MTRWVTGALIYRSKHSDFIVALYQEFGRKPFSYTDIKVKFPEFERGSLAKFHNSKLIKLQNGQRRSHQKTKVKNLWVLTDESIRSIQDYIGRITAEEQKKGENDGSRKGIENITENKKRK